MNSLLALFDIPRDRLTESEESALRAQACADAERLAVEIQDSSQVTAAEIEASVLDADQRGWPEVARACLLLEVLRAERDPREVLIAAIERLLDRATRDGDPAMVALALARRSEVRTTSGDPAQFVAASDDLARATVLLEAASGPPRTRARAHVNCGVAYGHRNLWELEDEQYRLAEVALSGEELGEIGLVILFNRAEVQLEWACAQRELGATEEACERARLAAAVMRAADGEGLPDGWRLELRVGAQLLDAIASGSGAPEPDPVAATGHVAGVQHLARALRASDPAAALKEADAALELINPAASRHVHNLALAVAAEIETALAGAETAGLRYARHLRRLRWEARLSALASMQSLLQVERLRSEHDLLTQHAYLDELTRLGNRRALHRHVEGLLAQGVSAVTVVALDVDNLKAINDTYGHAVGDETLVRLAALLRDAVRSDDIAVRVGGDEFLLVLPATRLDAARRRVRTILAGVSGAPWEEVSPGLQVTVSAGLASGEPSQLTATIRAADQALYRSKSGKGG